MSSKHLSYLNTAVILWTRSSMSEPLWRTLIRLIFINSLWNIKPWYFSMVFLLNIVVHQKHLPLWPVFFAKMKLEKSFVNVYLFDTGCCTWIPFQRSSSHRIEQILWLTDFVVFVISIQLFKYYFFDRKLDMDEKPKRRKVPKTLRLLCQKIQIQIDQIDKHLNQVVLYFQKGYLNKKKMCSEYQWSNCLSLKDENANLCFHMTKNSFYYFFLQWISLIKKFLELRQKKKFVFSGFQMKLTPFF